MNRNIIKHSLLALALACGTATAVAQTATPHRIFELNPDVRSAALGGTNLVSQSSNYIYTNPTHIFQVDKPLVFSLTAETMPKFKDVSRESLLAVGFGYKMSRHNALTAGVRMLSGLTLTRYNSAGDEQDTEIRPAQYTVDLSLAHRFNAHFSGFMSASLFHSATGSRAQSFYFGLGATYQTMLGLSSKHPTALEVTAAASQMGDDVPYTKGVSYRLPHNFGLGTSITTQLVKKHLLGLRLQGNYLAAYKQYHLGAGLEYIYDTDYSAQVGYQRLSKDVSRCSFGFSSRVGRGILSLAYHLGIGKYAQNTYSASFAFHF